MHARIHYYEINKQGQDYVIGDIHGHFTQVMELLQKVGFNFDRDRLFSVGDLVARGPQSESVMDWLEFPWFHPVRGNHDQIAVKFGYDQYRHSIDHVANGDGWMLTLLDHERIQYADALNQLPYAIEVMTNFGPVGIVHAEVPDHNWTRMVQLLKSKASDGAINSVLHSCMWAREKVLKDVKRSVEGITAVAVGHTPRQRALVLGNVYYLDTGGWMIDGHFTLLNLNTMQLRPAPHPKLQWDD